MQLKEEEKKRFSLIARAKSFTHAGRGIQVFIAGTHNAWVEITLSIIVVILGILLNISSIEWILIVFSIGVLLTSEAFNTAIEIDIDLTSPDHHPYARDTKDVAAGAVLITSIMVGIVWLIIFIPPIISLFSK